MASESKPRQEEGVPVEEDENNKEDTGPQLGNFVFPDGAQYEGEFILNKKEQRVRHGKGKYVDKSGEMYQGLWQEDTMHGDGTYLFATGAQYTGTFENNAFHGNGHYTWHDGASYTGRFRGNQMHDEEGVYLDNDGVKWAGKFTNGKYFNGKNYLILR